MSVVEITLRLPRTLIDAAQRNAAHGTPDLHALLEAAALQALSRVCGDLQTRDLHARLRALLDADFRDARSWPELQGRLMLRGYALRAGATGLMLLSHPQADPCATLRALGQNEASLAKRFGRPFPRPFTSSANSDAPGPAPLRPTG